MLLSEVCQTGIGAVKRRKSKEGEGRHRASISTRGSAAAIDALVGSLRADERGDVSSLPQARFPPAFCFCRRRATIAAVPVNIDAEDEKVGDP
jgi:hypothetical protein